MSEPSFPTPSPLDPLPSQIGRYQPLYLLGEGSWAEVFVCYDPVFDRRVAVKVLHSGLQGDRQRILQRFQTEVRVLGRLRHPKVVEVLDAGQEGDLPFLVMELCTGPSLEQLIHRVGRLNHGEVRWVAREIAAALDYLHPQSIVHRDIKPSNILFHDGGLKVTDFGIVHLDDSRLTIPGDAVGTPAFMAPEQIVGGAVDHRIDLYALGVALFQLLAGRYPFLGRPVSVMYQAVHNAPPPFSEVAPEQPASLDPFFTRALARNPDDRFESGAALCRALEQALPGVPIAPIQIPTDFQPHPPVVRRPRRIAQIELLPDPGAHDEAGAPFGAEVPGPSRMLEPSRQALDATADLGSLVLEASFQPSPPAVRVPEPWQPDAINGAASSQAMQPPSVPGPMPFSLEPAGAVSSPVSPTRSRETPSMKGDVQAAQPRHEATPSVSSSFLPGQSAWTEMEMASHEPPARGETHGDQPTGPVRSDAGHVSEEWADEPPTWNDSRPSRADAHVGPSPDAAPKSTQQVDKRSAFQPPDVPVGPVQAGALPSPAAARPHTGGTSTRSLVLGALLLFVLAGVAYAFRGPLRTIVMGPDHALVLVVVDSVPTGATILRADGTEVGEAPLKRPLRLDPDGSISLTARKQGWKTAGPIRKEAISGDELVFSFTLEEGEDAAAEGGRSDRSETSATKGRAGKARSPRSEGDASDRMSRERIAEAGFLIFRATPQALISINGRKAGRTGNDRSHRLPVGKHVVSLHSMRGERSVRRDVTVRAGETQVIEYDFINDGWRVNQNR